MRGYAYAVPDSQTATYTVTMIPGPPTISGSQGIWYLGRASVNDNCVDGSADPAQACYFNSTTLSLGIVN